MAVRMQAMPPAVGVQLLGRLGTVLVLYLVVTATAAAAASPLISLVGATFSSVPEGALCLWRGGDCLADFFATQGAGLHAALWSFLVVALLWTLATLALAGGILSALTESHDHPLARFAGSAGQSLLPFAALLGLLLVAYLVLGLAGYLVARLVAHGAGSNARLRDLLQALSWLPFLLGGLWVKSWHDLARVAYFRDRRGLAAAIRSSVLFALKRPFRSTGRTVTFGLGAWLVTLLAALAAGALGGRSGAAAGLLFLVEQIAVLLRATIRIAAYASFLRLYVRHGDLTGEAAIARL